jgi:hypothetical protein
MASEIVGIIPDESWEHNSKLNRTMIFIRIAGI